MLAAKVASEAVCTSKASISLDNAGDYASTVELP